MKLEKILIGTKNKAKVGEILEGLSEFLNYGIQILDCNILNIKKEPKENGSTLQENSFLKAKFYFKKTKIPTLADDSGFFIPYLNNEPGVKSNRWLGYKATDEELIEYTLERMKNAKNEERIAFLRTCLCFYDSRMKEPIFVEEEIKGFIAYEPSSRRVEGYPFRAILIIGGLNKYYDELTEEEHKVINQRLKALNKLKERLKEIYQFDN